MIIINISGLFFNEKKYKKNSHHHAHPTFAAGTLSVHVCCVCVWMYIHTRMRIGIYINVYIYRYCAGDFTVRTKGLLLK